LIIYSFEINLIENSWEENTRYLRSTSGESESDSRTNLILRPDRLSTCTNVLEVRCEYSVMSSKGRFHHHH